MTSTNDKETLSPVEQARELEKQGQEKDAFLAYLLIPGAQHLAGELARTNAKEYLGILREQTPKTDTVQPGVKLIEGELLLTLGKKEDALSCFREVATQIDHFMEADWQSGIIPSYIYPVEPPIISARQSHYMAYDFKKVFKPFTVGPGSHRDNWLIRRFIALSAWEDAAKEFERIWNIHQKQALVKQGELNRQQLRSFLDNGDKGLNTLPNDYKISKHQIEPRTLQFATDYAYFLTQRQQPKASQAMLLELLCLMDMDKEHRRESRYLDAELSYKEFIRLAYGAFKEASKEDELVTALQQNIAQGQNATRRVLARVRYHQSNVDEALALELAYLDNSTLDDITIAKRRGKVYEEASKLEEAAEAYKKALTILSAQKLSNEKNKENVQHWQNNIFEKLYRIYGALGQTNQVLETTLQGFKLQRERLSSFHSLKKAADKFRDLGKETQFFTWLRQQVAIVTDDKARANLYWFLGDYEMTLQAFENQPELILEFYSEQVAQKLREVGKENRFLSWMHQKVSSITNDYNRARFYWFLGDYKVCAQTLAPKLNYVDDDYSGYGYYKNWREKLPKLDKQSARLFLNALLEVEPQNVRVQFDLIQLQEPPNMKECIKTYEALLETEIDTYHGYPFKRDYGESIFNRIRFRDYYDLAYQLILLYEKNGQFDKLCALGLRIASKQEPFTTPDFKNELSLNDLNNCFSLLLQHANAELLDKLELLWRDYPDLPAKHQLAHRKYGGLKRPEKLKTFGWNWPQNLPKGTKLLASNENVLSLTRDDKYIYAGHPWGMAIYDFQGEGVIRVALETAVLALVAGNGYIWAGTSKGLFRLQRDRWTAAHLWLHGDIPKDEREDEFYKHNNTVSTLVLDNEQLWIGLYRNVQRLDISQMTLRAYSDEELKIEDREEFNQILPDKNYVWVDTDIQNGVGMRRYDRQTDTWEELDYQDNSVNLITLLDGILFGYVKVNEDLGHRPCLIDRITLEITPILIDNQSGKVPHISKPFCYLGTYQNQRVFAADYIAYVYDDKTNQLKRMGHLREQDDLIARIETRIPSHFITENFWRRADGAIVFDGYSNNYQIEGHSFITNHWTLLFLPDGTRIIGGKHPESPRYEYNEEEPYGLSRESEEESGGLHLISPEGKHRHISAENRTDSIMGEVVFSVVPNRQLGQTWLCTNHGISILDVHNQVIDNLSRRKGLTDNRVTAGFATEDGDLYFATGWDEEKKGGGRTVFDTETTIFMTLPDSKDLTEQTEKALRQADERLQKFLERESEEHQVMPYLGGFVIAKQTMNGKTFLCGTRGVIIQEHEKRWLDVLLGKNLPCLSFNIPLFKVKREKTSSFFKIPNLKVKLNQGSGKQFLKEAEAVDALFENCHVDKQLALLEKSLLRYNPYYRAEAISALMSRLNELREEVEDEETDENEEADENGNIDEEGYCDNWEFVRYRKHPHLIDEDFLHLLVGVSTDSNVRVRSTALYVLLQSDNHQVIPVLQERLTDTNKYIRAVAAIALAYRGEVALKQIEEILACLQKKSCDYHKFPYGANSSESVLSHYGGIYEALAPLANAEIFDLLLKYPLGRDRYNHYNTYTAKAIFQPLGKRLCHYPEVIERMLQIYPGDDDLERFIPHLFKHASKATLPILHKGLTSDDRVVRSNAARACGTIGDSSSISPLIKALDLESGLSRASIVWALGEIQAQEALPDLINLYVDARNDEQRTCRRGSGAGYRLSQMAAQTFSHYEALRTLSDVGAEWDEIKAASQPEPLEPRRDEELLSQRYILEAVRKIGAESSQEFYQKLAGETDNQARLEAAKQLAKGGKPYSEKNIQILRNLLTHVYYIDVRMAAAVSLLILGDEAAQKHILEWLDSSDNEKRDIFQALYRVKEASKLTFARKQLEAIVADKEINEATYLNDNVRWARQMLAKMRQYRICPIRQPIVEPEFWVPHLPGAEGECLGVLEEEAYSLTISPDSRVLATGSCDEKVRTWDLHRGKILQTSKEEHEDRIDEIAMSPDGKYLATGSWDTSVRIWETVKGHCLFCCEGHERDVVKVNWSPDGNYLASASKDYTIRIWDTHTGACLQLFEGHERPVSWVEWSPDGNLLASGSHDHTIRIWETASGKLVLDWLAGNVNVVTWSPNGRWLASGADYKKTISIWDTQSWELIHQWKAHVQAVLGPGYLAWSPNSQLLASGGAYMNRQGICLWEPTTGQPVTQFKKSQGKGKRENELWSLAWSPNGGFIAAAYYDDILFWDTRSYI